MKRIFIVGVPRSGTTLLQSMLAAHPQVTSFTESHFFTRDPAAGGRKHEGRVKDWLNGRVREWLDENALEPIDYRPSRHLIRSIRGRRSARALVGVLDRAAEQRGCTVWVEKTPRHLWNIPLIEAATDGTALFLHVLRDKDPTMASLQQASRQWGPGYSFEQCAGMVAEGHAISQAHATRRNHHVLRYEALTADVRTTLLDITRFLQIDFDERMLSDYPAAARRLVLADERWKANNLRSIGEVVGASPPAAG